MAGVIHYPCKKRMARKEGIEARFRGKKQSYLFTRGLAKEHLTPAVAQRRKIKRTKGGLRLPDKIADTTCRRF